MATFHFDLVSPEKLAFSGDVDQVDIPGLEGDFGVLAGHAPVVAAIRPGILTVTTGGTKQKIIVLGGLAEVSDKGLTRIGRCRHFAGGTGSNRVRRHDRRDASQAFGKGRLRARPRDRAARPFQEHPERAQHDGVALAARFRARMSPEFTARLEASVIARTPRTAAPQPDTHRAETARRDQRQGRAAPIAIGRTPAAGRCARSADRFPRRNR